MARTGTGTKSADHTTMPKPFAPAAEREITFPIPQLSPAATQTSIGRIAAAPPHPRAVPRPRSRVRATATSAPTSCIGVGRSRRATAPITSVKIIWHCSTTAARPAGSPRCMAVNSRPNWPALMNRPMPASTRHVASGFGTKNTSGTATRANRRATSTSGGVSPQAEVDDDEVHAPDDGDERVRGGGVGESPSPASQPGNVSTSSESLR